MEIKNRHILIIIVVGLLAAFFSGAFLLPGDSETRTPINETFNNKIQCEGKINLEESPTPSGDYDGLVSGICDGTIFLLGKRTGYSGDINGLFSGKVFGTCLDSQCLLIEGNLSGYGNNLKLEGVQIDIKSQGIDAPQWMTFLVAGLITLGVLQYLGILPAVLRTIAQSRWIGREYITKQDEELYEELRDFLYDQWHIETIEQVKEVLPNSEEKPTVLYWLVELPAEHGNRWTILRYVNNMFKIYIKDASPSDWARVEAKVERLTILEKRGQIDIEKMKQFEKQERKLKEENI